MGFWVRRWGGAGLGVEQGGAECCGMLGAVPGGAEVGEIELGEKLWGSRAGL